MLDLQVGRRRQGELEPQTSRLELRSPEGGVAYQFPIDESLASAKRAHGDIHKILVERNSNQAAAERL